MLNRNECVEDDFSVWLIIFGALSVVVVVELNTCKISSAKKMKRNEKEDGQNRLLSF